MTQTDRQRWDQRYRTGAYAERPWPSAYLQQCIPQIAANPVAARALDVACGRGRNSLYLAQQGLAVDAVDVSPAALAHGANSALQTGHMINWQCQDVLRWASARCPLPEQQYGLIIMFRFVASALLPVLVQQLQPGGYLVVEEHMQWSGAQQLCGPSNVAFRVTSTELQEALIPHWQYLDMVDEFAGLVEEPDGSQAALSRILVRRQD